MVAPTNNRSPLQKTGTLHLRCFYSRASLDVEYQSDAAAGGSSNLQGFTTCNKP